MSVQAQNAGYYEKDITLNRYVDGTLLLPEGSEKKSLAIIIPGSGPTDRNGNQTLLRNNSLKKLAEGLSQRGVATFRYDKRVVKQLRQGTFSQDTSFDDFISDAISVIDFFRASGDFNTIYVIGHSQGSLVGMVAARGRADAFISLSGSGHTIDQLITEQVGVTAPSLLEETERIFALLRQGKTTSDYPPPLSSIFDASLQPFMMSWMKYDPKQEISRLSIPVLIINGGKDIQVSNEEAKSLQDASPNSELLIIDNMNHVLVPIEGSDLENSKSYNETHRKLSPELIDAIVQFLN